MPYPRSGRRRLASCLFALHTLGLFSRVHAAEQCINTGQVANDQTGTNARTAFQMVNSNFADFYAFLYAPITGPVTIAPGTNTSVIGAGALTNGMHAFMPAKTTKCNPLAFAAVPTDCPVAPMQSMLRVGIGGGVRLATPP